MKRTICSCLTCQAPCRTMPGMLVPGDVERLRPDATGRDAWALQHLEASEGALVARRGLMFRIPTIVPGRQADGRTVCSTARTAAAPYTPWRPTAARTWTCT